MSKKLAEPPGRIVLDVKFGSGASMKTRGDAGLQIRVPEERGLYRFDTETGGIDGRLGEPSLPVCGRAVSPKPP